MQADSRLGRVVVAPEVLVTIVQQTVLTTPGVVRLHSHWPENIGKLLRIHTVGEGVAIQVDQDALTIDVHVVADMDAQMLELGHTLQHAISRSITDIAGLEVKAINVHIEDVEHSVSEEAA